MPMTIAPTISKRFQGKQLKENDWLELAELWKTRLNPHLDRMPLSKLGDMAIGLIGENSMNELEPTVPLEGADEHGYNQQGIYGCTPIVKNWLRRTRTLIPLKGKYAASCWDWGLTRNGKWISIQVFLTANTRNPRKTFFTPALVVIKEVDDLPTLCKVTSISAEEVVACFMTAVSNYHKQRKKAYRRVRNLHQHAVEEMRLIRLFTKE